MGKSKIQLARRFRSVLVWPFAVGRCDKIHSKSGETSCEEDVQAGVFGDPERFNVEYDERYVFDWPAGV